MDPILQALLTGVVTLAAAFFGAWYAFRLNDNARKRLTLQDHVSAVNRALFVLGSHLNTLVSIQNQIIEPFRNDAAKFMSMRPAQPIGEDSPRVDLGSLEFLLETEYREMLMELQIEQESFDVTLQALNERSRLHLEVLQPRLASLGIAEYAEYREDELLEAIGRPLVLHMQRATDNAISSVDATLDSHTDLAERFHAAMKVLFPERKFIEFKPDFPSKTPMDSTGGAGESSPGR